MFILISVAARLLISTFFCQQNLIIHVFGETSALPSKGCGKGQQPKGCPESLPLLTSVSKRCLHRLHTLFRREMVKARRRPAGLLLYPPSDSTLGPRLRRPCLQPGQRTCRGKYAWFTFLMLSFCDLVFRGNPVLVLLRGKIVLSN